ncbi:SDR family oxidoreductase [Burkholderia sp. S171]|uniref:SDR family oxidoreductase n=1 Tax=Burkholderia sp. S171 TaxID=1641860 RepID=UPI00349E745F
MTLPILPSSYVLAQPVNLGLEENVGAAAVELSPGDLSVIEAAVLMLCEGLRQEVKTYDIRTTVISPGAVDTQLPNSITEPDVADNVNKFYEENAIPAESFARAVAFAISQPPEGDVNEILFRPTRQEL